MGARHLVMRTSWPLPAADDVSAGGWGPTRVDASRSTSRAPGRCVRRGGKLRGGVSGRRWWIAFGALLVAAVGFFAAAGMSAWWARHQRAAPWRALRVEHEGLEGATMRTRVVFEDPKLSVQDVELTASPEGDPEMALVALRDGSQLTVRFGTDGRPSVVEEAGGTRAELGYRGNNVDITFLGAKGKLAERVVRAPVELRSALRLVLASASISDRLAGLLVGVARADEEETVGVQRDVPLSLHIRAPDGGADGTARIEASCAPFTCVALTPEAKMPGKTSLRIGVSGSVPRSEIPAPKRADLTDFRRAAEKERRTARKTLPHVEAAVAALGVTAIACAREKLDRPICVRELATGERAAGVIDAIEGHDLGRDARLVDVRAEALYREERASAKLAKTVKIEVCASRQGFSRACTTIDGNPFGKTPMASQARAVELRRGIGGTLVGAFEMVQSDGSDCNFSPSPRTSGVLRMTFDNRQGLVTATLEADESGTRPDLRCSMGMANMRWSQRYSATLTQTFPREQLLSGGKLPLRLSGTMSGTSSYSFSNCRTSGGASANCPGGKRDSYGYPMELVGELDLSTQRGSGRLVVTRAPLATSGSWRLPASKAP
jgi:hypothetical protein